MRDILICTVGTSLLGNLERSEDADILILLEKRNEKGLAVALGKIAPEERICGAEINSINGILGQDYLQNQTRLVFLVSDTDDGRFLGQVLKLYYELSGKPWRFDDVEVSTVEGLTHKVIGLSAVGQLFHDTFRYRFQQQRDRVLPPDSGLVPEKKIIRYEDKNKGKHQGLQQWLERLRDFSYVKSIESFYYNPDLPIRNYFRKTSKGDVSKVEGWFSDGKATTKFNVVITAETEGQRDAVLADLNELL
jgi:hypothetical protein